MAESILPERPRAHVFRFFLDPADRCFCRVVLKRFGEDVPPTLQDSLADAFLDSRYELTSAVAPGRGGDPVPQLFVDGWRRLSPIMNQALPALPNQTASLYSSFIGAADKLATAGGAGLNLTPDALKGMAGIIAPTSPPPHNISRPALEEAIGTKGFQLWRFTKKAEARG